MIKDTDSLIIRKGISIKETMESLNTSAKGIVLVTDSRKKLLGVVTDGDIRRALLAGKSLNTPVSSIMNHHPVKMISVLSLC